jgi:hypothetical protein
VDRAKIVEEIFESFSDQLQFSAVSVVERHLGFTKLKGFQPERVRDMFDALRNMGFELTELGGCPRHVPLVLPAKAMVAMMTTFGTASGDPHVAVTARDEKQLLRTTAILQDLRVRWRPAR